MRITKLITTYTEILFSFEIHLRHFAEMPFMCFFFFFFAVILFFLPHSFQDDDLRMRKRIAVTFNSAMPYIGEEPNCFSISWVGGEWGYDPPPPPIYVFSHLMFSLCFRTIVICVTFQGGLGGDIHFQWAHSAMYI